MGTYNPPANPPAKRLFEISDHVMGLDDFSFSTIAHHTLERTPKQERLRSPGEHERKGVGNLAHRPRVRVNEVCGSQAHVSIL
jgi:tRNA (Thr-GGU) A37 N-methylase